MLAVIISLGVWWLVRPQRIGPKLEVLEALQRALRQVRPQLHTVSSDWRPSADSRLPPCIEAVIEAAWLAGDRLYHSLSRLELALIEGHRLHRDAQSLLRLYWGRAGMAATLAVGIELLAARSGLDLSWVALRDQLVRGLLAAAVLSSGILILNLSLPASWLIARQSISPVVADWLAVHIDGEVRPGHAWSESLAAIHARELTMGVSLRDDKRRLLEDWSEAQLEIGRRRLGTVGDLMPLGELVGIGLPLALLTVDGVLTLL
jgi:hypothetical protein